MHSLFRRDGFTLTELLVTLVILGILLGSIGYRTRILPRASVTDAAEMLASEFDRAMADAIASGRYVHLALDTSSDRWTVWVDQRSDPTISVPAHLGHELSDDDLRFGSGNANYGPMGDVIPSSIGVPQDRIVCDAWARCSLGGGTTATIFIRHRGDPDIVAGVTVTISGNAESWTYKPSNSSWQ